MSRVFTKKNTKKELLSYIAELENFVKHQNKVIENLENDIKEARIELLDMLGKYLSLFLEQAGEIEADIGDENEEPDISLNSFMNEINSQSQGAKQKKLSKKGGKKK
jgi:uncharacterized coiled-coil protein SlyX